MEKPHITYKELLQLVSYGIFAMKFKGISVHDERLDSCDSIKNAAYGGIYTGSPGRDIYFMLPYLDINQMKEIVSILVERFPKVPPGNHVNIGAFLRFIYGQFEKQGILRSDKDFEKMKDEKLDWKRSRMFLELLYNKLEKNNNFYGMSILCEMNAHRLGDEAVINKNKTKILEMEELYKKSVRYAYKCKSYKQLFTPYYWAFKYFYKFKDNEKALFYACLTLTQAEKYSPDARPGYVDKLSDCVRYIKKFDRKKWEKICKKYKKFSKNKCIKKVIKKFGE